MPEERSLGKLMQMVQGGAVRDMVRGVLSNDKETVANANATVANFMSMAGGVLPLTAKQAEKTAQLASDALGDVDATQSQTQTKIRSAEQTQKTIAAVSAAKTGLEIALAWSERITGSIKWAAEKRVFLGGSCNPTTWWDQSHKQYHVDLYYCDIVWLLRRKDVAIPLLTDAQVPFYNPQVNLLRVLITR